MQRPLSKQTHKLSNEYCKRTEPARFYAPEAYKTHYIENVPFIYYLLIGESKDKDILADGIIPARISPVIGI